MAIASSSALLNEEMNKGTSTGIRLFARFTILPVSKLAPLAICAFIILSASSNKVGIKRRAIVIIIAISCTGKRMRFNGFSKVSMAAVKLIGDVVNVKTDEQTISIISLEPICNAHNKDSVLILIRQKETNTVSPGANNKFIIIVKDIIKSNARSPFKINFKGTFDNFIIESINAPLIA